jgi:co-chaperonin GroES (HSP10)
MKATPQHDYIFVRPTKDDGLTQTKGGLWMANIQGNETKGNLRGTKVGIVAAVGPGPWNEAGTNRKPMSCKVGDKVWYMERECNAIIEGELIHMIQDYMVMAVEPAESVAEDEAAA